MDDLDYWLDQEHFRLEYMNLDKETKEGMKL